MFKFGHTTADISLGRGKSRLRRIAGLAAIECFNCYMTAVYGTYTGSSRGKEKHLRNHHNLWVYRFRDIME